MEPAARRHEAEPCTDHIKMCTCARSLYVRSAGCIGGNVRHYAIELETCHVPWSRTSQRIRFWKSAMHSMIQAKARAINPLVKSELRMQVHPRLITVEGFLDRQGSMPQGFGETIWKIISGPILSIDRPSYQLRLLNPFFWNQ